MKPNLYELLQDYSKNNFIPMHMPGHKRNSKKFGLLDAADVDITEIDGFDDYHEPREIIKTIQEEAANLYHTKASFYLVNGSTCGIQTAISSACTFGEEIVIARNCHKAVYHSVYLNGLKPHYIYPTVNAYGIMSGICPQMVEDALRETNAGAVVLTSPTYEGNVSDISRIASICHAHGAVLIVDEAHGAHFNFQEAFPKTAMECGADYVIESLHKTLPSYTQTAILHVCGENVDVNRVRRFLSIYQTSSPSYIFLAGINRCLDYMQSEQGRMDNAQYVGELQKLRTMLKNLKHITLYEPKDAFDYDCGKIILCAKNLGKHLYDVLLAEYKIQLEMASADYVIAMTSIGDCREWYERLGKALLEIDQREEFRGANVPTEEGELTKNDGAVMCPAKVVMTPLEAWSVAKEEQELAEVKDSIGKISLEWVYAYPPGIPLIYPGEEITRELLCRMQKLRAAGVSVKGMQDQKGEHILCIK